MNGREARGTPLPIVATRAEAGRWLGAAGVLACSLCCLSIPGIAAALSAVGLGFLRNDRILFPGAVASSVVVLWAFRHAWRRHGRAGPGLLGAAAVGGVLGGFRLPAPLGSALMTAGAGLMLAAAAWDWRVTRRCGTSGSAAS